MTSAQSNFKAVYSCDGTFKENCDPSRDYTGLADVRHFFSPVAQDSSKIILCSTALDCPGRFRYVGFHEDSKQSFFGDLSN